MTAESKNPGSPNTRMRRANSMQILEQITKAKKEDPAAQFVLAERLRKGDGLTQDKAKAMDLYKQAVAAWFTEARKGKKKAFEQLLKCLEIFLEEGMQIDQDRETMKALFRPHLKKEDVNADTDTDTDADIVADTNTVSMADAQYGYAMCIELGTIAPKNNNDQKATDREESLSAVKSSDTEEARMWYAEAARQGHQKAVAAEKRLMKILDQRKSLQLPSDSRNSFLSPPSPSEAAQPTEDSPSQQGNKAP